MNTTPISADDILALVFARNAFYRRMHFLALGLLVLSICVIIMLVWMLWYLYKSPTMPLYFATDETSKLINVIPVDRPNMPLADVVAWTNNALQQAMSFDFINYRSQLQGSQKYFTDYGWGNYVDALKASNNLIGVTNYKMIVIAQVVDQPKLSAQGILGKSYAYRFNLPMLVTYLLPPFDYATANTFSNPVTVSVVVQRRPILQSDKGLGIAQVVANIPVAASQVKPTAGSGNAQAP